jgi:hypothetical protein
MTCSNLANGENVNYWELLTFSTTWKLLEKPMEGRSEVSEALDGELIYFAAAHLDWSLEATRMAVKVSSWVWR